MKHIQNNPDFPQSKKTSAQMKNKPSGGKALRSTSQASYNSRFETSGRNKPGAANERIRAVKQKPRTPSKQRYSGHYRASPNGQINTDMYYKKTNAGNSADRRHGSVNVTSGRGNADNDSFKGRLYSKLNTWRLSFSIDAESIIKGIVLGLFIIFLSIVQTTLFTRFRPFGVTPDLLLPFVVAIGISEKERWGAVVGLISAFVIDALGGTSLMLLPLLYVPAGFVCGILTTYRFRDSFSVIAVYTLVTSFIRSFISMIISFNTIHSITFGETVLKIALPEFFANIIFAVIPHILVKLTMRPFHKTRAERTAGIE